MLNSLQFQWSVKTDHWFIKIHREDNIMTNKIFPSYDEIILEYDGGVETPMRQLLIDSECFDKELLENSMALYVPHNPECPYLIYHFISGGYMLVGLRKDYCTNDFSEIEHYLLES